MIVKLAGGFRLLCLCSAWRHWDDDLNWLWLSLAYCSVQFESPTITNQLVERDASHHTLLFPPWICILRGCHRSPTDPMSSVLWPRFGLTVLFVNDPDLAEELCSGDPLRRKEINDTNMDINGYQWILTHVVYRCDGHVRVMYVNVCYGPLMAFDDKDLSAEDFCIWILLYAFVATFGFTRPDSGLGAPRVRDALRPVAPKGCCQWMLPSSPRSKISLYKYNHNFELL